MRAELAGSKMLGKVCHQGKPRTLIDTVAELGGPEEAAWWGAGRANPGQCLLGWEMQILETQLQGHRSGKFYMEL